MDRHHFERIAELEDAVDECGRFINRANAAIEEIKSEGGRYVLISGSATQASAKRASMDATRALVAVRHSKV